MGYSAKNRTIAERSFLHCDHTETIEITTTKQPNPLKKHGM